MFSRFLSSAKAKYLLPISLIALLWGCQSSQATVVELDPKTDLSSTPGHVVLLHGMYRSSYAMRPVERYLNTLGYQVTNISYPSTSLEIEELAEQYLHPVISQLRTETKGPIHFVTHSMGGILVRHYLKNHPTPDVGNVVMIAPPNKGTDLVDVFGGGDFVTDRTGPAGKQLSASDQSFVNQLGPVDFHLGVIAGNKNGNWVTSSLLPGDDDGVVSVESTKVENMADFVTVPYKHYRLRGAKPVLQQAAHFLKYGAFYR